MGTLDCSKIGRARPPLQLTRLIFQKITRRLTDYGVSKIKMTNCGCHFRGFQLELDTLDTKNFEIGSVVTKLQLSVLREVVTSLIKNTFKKSQICLYTRFALISVLFGVASSDF